MGNKGKQRGDMVKIMVVSEWEAIEQCTFLELEKLFRVCGDRTPDSMSSVHGPCRLIPIPIIWDVHSSYLIGSITCR